MAITNYTDLQSEVASWLARSDLTNNIPTFIQLAEKQMSRRLRVKNQETTATGTAATTIALPSDYVEMIALTLTASGDERALRQRDRFSGTAINNSSADVYYYTIEGGNIVITPEPAGTETYTLQYFASVPALSGASPTNWLITAHPDLYLYGVLIQSAPFLKDDPRLMTWQSLFEQIMTAIEIQNLSDRWSGSPISSRAQMSCW
jgi:hypothetical protein